IAERVIERFNREKIYSSPIVTEVVPVATWFEAEPYHQEYFARNPFQGYCTAVVAPKVMKFRKLFSTKLKP
ncbi:MAG TPA: peptide-methionine (S)-S-oxide reductase, partial [Nitrospira sp.]|nr:peptide-methionine (S)-S-oxide reductase [Nitrospira sp.]